jgi:hypothetical protein
VRLYYKLLCNLEISSSILKSCIECPPTWFIFHDKCLNYQTSNQTSISWAEARDICLKNKADLIDIPLDNYFEFVDELRNNFSFPIMVFLSFFVLLMNK